jgi:hypothetical protein
MKSEKIKIAYKSLENVANYKYFRMEVKNYIHKEMKVRLNTQCFLLFQLQSFVSHLLSDNVYIKMKIILHFVLYGCYLVSYIKGWTQIKVL